MKLKILFLVTLLLSSSLFIFVQPTHAASLTMTCFETSVNGTPVIEFDFTYSGTSNGGRTFYANIYNGSNGFVGSSATANVTNVNSTYVPVQPGLYYVGFLDQYDWYTNAHYYASAACLASPVAPTPVPSQNSVSCSINGAQSALVGQSTPYSATLSPSSGVSIRSMNLYVAPFTTGYHQDNWTSFCSSSNTSCSAAQTFQTPGKYYVMAAAQDVNFVNYTGNPTYTVPDLLAIGFNPLLPYPCAIIVDVQPQPTNTPIPTAVVPSSTPIPTPIPPTPTLPVPTASVPTPTPLVQKQYNASWVVTSGGGITNFKTLNPGLFKNPSVEWKLGSYPLAPSYFRYDSTYFSSHYPFISKSNINVGSTSTRNYVKIISDYTVSDNGAGVNAVNTAVTVVYVQGNLTFNQDFAPLGTVIFITSGNIVIDGAVKTLNAILISDKTISTGSSGFPLSASGAWIAYGDSNAGPGAGTGIVLQRTHATSTQPAEKVQMNLSMYTALKDAIGTSQYIWEEVNP